MLVGTGVRKTVSFKKFLFENIKVVTDCFFICAIRFGSVFGVAGGLAVVITGNLVLQSICCLQADSGIV